MQAITLETPMPKYTYFCKFFVINWDLQIFLNKDFIVGVVCELFILRVLINKQKYMDYIYHVL